MLEDFVNALENFKTNKLRTFLSLLGILIGVSSVIIVTTLASSLKESMLRNLRSFNLDIISIYPRATASKFKFTEDKKLELIKNVKGIEHIFFYTNAAGSPSRRGKYVNDVQVVACDYGVFAAKRMEFDTGGGFSCIEFAKGYQQAVLGSNIARELFPEGNAVGKSFTIRFNGEVFFGFQVKGVLKSTSSFYSNNDNKVFITRPFFQKKINPMPNTDLVEIKVFDEQLAGKIQEDIKKFIENKTNEKNPFWTFSPQKQIEQSGKMLNMVNMVLSSIAAISLLVGGIGIMNIMLVTVTERKKEIGIRKALGASHAAIRNQFLVESAALTLTGGVAGTFAGLIISKIAVEYFFPSHFIFVPNIYGSAISFLFSGFIGIFFGLSPAIKASKLDPVAALTD